MKLRAAGVAVLLAVPALALPADAARVRPITLTDTVTVETSRSGSAEVLLPDDVQVSMTDGVAFDGAGRLVAVWLERTDHAMGFLTSYRLPDFAGGRQETYGTSPTTECKPVPEQFPLTHDCTDAKPVQVVLLPEGRYRLTVLADGAPLQVTLRLQGLDAGSTTVTPQRSLASTQQTLPARESVGSSLVTFGRAAELPGQVQTFVVATAKARGDAPLQEASVCERPDTGAVPFAFGPHCPGGTSGAYAYRVGSAQGFGVFASSSSSEGGGPVGLGGSFGNSDGVTLGSTLGVWLARG